MPTFAIAAAFENRQRVGQKELPSFARVKEQQDVVAIKTPWRMRRSRGAIVDRVTCPGGSFHLFPQPCLFEACFQGKAANQTAMSASEAYTCM
jgi:hypothetical protein